MPSRRRVAQQAACRKRQATAQAPLLAQKGLPALPAIPTLPGYARWNQMVAQARRLLSEAAEEMQTYHDARSERWQESERASELLARLEQLQEALAQLEE